MLAIADNSLEDALLDLAGFLEREQVPYMVIGAVAGLAWGLRRATFDVDLTIWAGAREERLARALASSFSSRAPDPVVFVAETGVLPLSARGVSVDVIFGSLPYEENAIRRARPQTLGGRTIPFCSPEDLIVHKIISERPKDLDDVRQLARAAGATLDCGYLDPIVEGLATDLGRPAILTLYRSLF